MKFSHSPGDVYKEYACDICGSVKAIEVPFVRLYTKGQPVHICKECGFVYVKKRRPSESIACIWTKKMFGKAYTARTPLMLARHMYVAEFINQSIDMDSRKLCDIGAGEGQFLEIIKKNYGASVLGIEPSKANCMLMKERGIASFNGTIEEYLKNGKFTGGKFDIVTMMWTLENATSCRGLLTGAREILSDSGYIVVATGSRILVPFSKPLHLYFSANPADTHPSRFSFNTLSALLAVAGFKVMYINRYLNDGLVLCVIAKKCRIAEKPRFTGDDFRQVRDFFKRWHKETSYYKKNKNG